MCYASIKIKEGIFLNLNTMNDKNSKDFSACGNCVYYNVTINFKVTTSDSKS